MAKAKKKNPAAVELGKRGAKARLTKMTGEQRSQVASKAAAARWTQKQDAPLKNQGDPLDTPKKAPAKKK